MSDDIVEQLRSATIFNGLPNDVLSAIASKVTKHTLVEDDVLMQKGDFGDSLFLIHKGWVKVVTKDSKGDELILNKYGPGESVGEMALFDKGPRSATVIALGHTEVIQLKQDVFQEILDQRPDVALAIIRGYSGRLRFATKYIEKAIDWAQKISVGDYSFIEQAYLPINNNDLDQDDKASQLLSAFFTMVKKVKEREDGLKLQVERLSFEIDQERRKREFEEITGTEFYSRLKEQAKQLRQKRAKD